MSMVEKKKHLFVVTLDNGKKTYFDFVDHNIYGVSGKVVQNFNTEAKRILKSKEDDNFLAMYFYERTLTWPCRELERKILEISYNYLPAVVIPFITHADTNEMRNCIVEDAQKIGIIWMAIGAFITMYIITSSFAMSAHTKICISRFA